MNTKDSRTCCSLQAMLSPPLLSLWFLCMSLLYQHLLSSPPPSSSGQSDPLYTTPGDLGVKSLWVVRMRLILSNLLHLPEVLRQREFVCGLCLGPVWVHRHLTGEQDMIRGWRSGPGCPVRCTGLNRFDVMQTDWTGISHEETDPEVSRSNWYCVSNQQDEQGSVSQSRFNNLWV